MLTSEALLDVEEVSVRFGGIHALDGVSFSIQPGRICGLIGPNGAGKTTLFNCVSRIYNPTSGRITFDGHDLLQTPRDRITGFGVTRTFQNLGLYGKLSVLENVLLGAHLQMRGGFLAYTLALPGLRRQEREHADGAMAILRRLQLDHVADHPAEGLPFGTLKRIELARALVSKPKLVMLDEPANGLSHSEVDELSGLIRDLRDELGITILLVEHHMAMVMGISDHIVVLNFGKRIAEGAPADVQRNPAVIDAYLGGAA